MKDDTGRARLTPKQPDPTVLQVFSMCADASRHSTRNPIAALLQPQSIPSPTPSIQFNSSIDYLSPPTRMTPLLQLTHLRFFKMPPRLQPSQFSPRSLRQLSHRLYYSTESSQNQPLIRVTNIPAPSSGHIRVLELNRPQARNAISKALLASLRAEIEDVHSQYGPNGEEKPLAQRFGGAAGVNETGPTRAVVLASFVDSCFCAGADLKERKGFTPEEYVLANHTYLNT